MPFLLEKEMESPLSFFLRLKFTERQTTYCFCAVNQLEDNKRKDEKKWPTCWINLMSVPDRYHPHVRSTDKRFSDAAPLFQNIQTKTLHFENPPFAVKIIIVPCEGRAKTCWRCAFSNELVSELIESFSLEHCFKYQVNISSNSNHSSWL